MHGKGHVAGQAGAMGEKVGQGDLMPQLFVHGGIVSQDSINRGVKSDVGVVIEEAGEGHGGEGLGQRADAVDRLGVGGHGAVTAALSSVITENNLSVMQDANRHSCHPRDLANGPGGEERGPVQSVEELLVVVLPGPPPCEASEAGEAGEPEKVGHREVRKCRSGLSAGGEVGVRLGGMSRGEAMKDGRRGG